MNGSSFSLPIPFRQIFYSLDHHSRPNSLRFLRHPVQVEKLALHTIPTKPNTIRHFYYHLKNDNARWWRAIPLLPHQSFKISCKRSTTSLSKIQQNSIKPQSIIPKGEIPESSCIQIVKQKLLQKIYSQHQQARVARAGLPRIFL